jgi:hypothetical protein
MDRPTGHDGYQAFWWPLPTYNEQGKQVGLENNQGSFGEYEPAFDEQMEAIVDINGICESE